MSKAPSCTPEGVSSLYMSTSNTSGHNLCRVRPGDKGVGHPSSPQTQQQQGRVKKRDTQRGSVCGPAQNIYQTQWVCRLRALHFFLLSNYYNNIILNGLFKQDNKAQNFVV